MKRLMEKRVFLGLVIAWRRATWPTSRSPSLVNATTDGVVRPPSALGMTTGSPPSITATTELVVPRSMPMILDAMSTPVIRVLPPVPDCHSRRSRPCRCKRRTAQSCLFGTESHGLSGDMAHDATRHDPVKLGPRLDLEVEASPYSSPNDRR